MIKQKLIKGLLPYLIIFTGLSFAGFVSFIFVSHTGSYVLTPTPTQSIQTNQVSVSVNNTSNFTISVNDGANQCDVLNKALSDGKISSLYMRYDSNYETYSVYKINGIGKENSVWWTYTVNGQSPNQGCSYIKTKNNDQVEWKYIGS